VAPPYISCKLDLFYRDTIELNPVVFLFLTGSLNCSDGASQRDLRTDEKMFIMSQARVLLLPTVTCVSTLYTAQHTKQPNSFRCFASLIYHRQHVRSFRFTDPDYCFPLPS
jgi:hypothetical protein